MLTITKTTTLNATSTFDGTTAQGYQATINSENPANMSISNWIADYAVYKAHRSECSTERAQFEDAAFELQDVMIAEQEKGTPEGESGQVAQPPYDSEGVGQVDVSVGKKNAQSA